MESVQQIAMAEEQNERIAQVVRKDGGKLLNFIKRQVPDEEDARDIFQDVLWQLTESLRGLEQIERLTSWVFRVARNKIADLYRRPRPLPASRQQAEPDDDGIPAVSLMDALRDLGPDPEELLHDTAIWEAIESALDELPAAQREAFVLHEFEGLGFREIAARTGETENTLRMRKFHAVQFLRDRLAIWYND